MPGHVKLGKPGEPDPDPSPYLIVSMEMKREDMLKPYDPKKSVWVPTDDHGFREGLLENVMAPRLLSCVAMRKKSFHLLKLARSTLPSLRNARTWPI